MYLSFKHITLQDNVFAYPKYLSLSAPPFIGHAIDKTMSWLAFSKSDGVVQTQHRSPFLQGQVDLNYRQFIDLLAVGSQYFGFDDIEVRLPALIPQLIVLEDWAVSYQPSELTHLHADDTYYLKLTPRSFIEGLPGDQRRVLKKQTRSGMRAEQVGTQHLARVHDLLSRNRAWKGYPMNISEQDLSSTFKALPDNYWSYLCFGPDGKVVGAAIVLKVNVECWYTYLLGHLPVVGMSPILSLIEAIHYDARTAGAHILDLGTAGSRGQVLQGLAAFKLSLGCQIAPKLTLRYRKPNPD